MAILLARSAFCSSVLRLILLFMATCWGFFFFIANNSLEGENSNHRIADINKAIAELQKEKQRIISNLKNEIRLLCWVMTKPTNVEYRKAVMETWGKRCHLTLFMVGAEKMLAVEKHPTLPPKSRRRVGKNAFLVYLDMGKDTQKNLWSKTRHAFVYIEENFPDAYDWVLKCDDDTFVIVENLRLFLRDKDPDGPHYFGARYAANAPEGYNSGGPGYVMSRKAAGRFAAQLKRNSDDGDGCLLNAESTEAEDYKVAQCLHKVGVTPADTRDEDGRFRFVPFNPENSLTHATLPKKYNWFWGYTAYKFQDGFECCSDTAVSFHYNTPTMMRVLEYFTYYAGPFSTRALWTYSYSVSD